MRFFGRSLALIVALAAGTAWPQDNPDAILSAVVGVQAKALPNARTIGYLVIEAESVRVTPAERRCRSAMRAGSPSPIASSGFAGAAWRPAQTY